MGPVSQNCLVPTSSSHSSIIHGICFSELFCANFMPTIKHNMWEPVSQSSPALILWSCLEAYNARDMFLRTGQHQHNVEYTGPTSQSLSVPISTHETCFSNCPGPIHAHLQQKHIHVHVEPISEWCPAPTLCSTRSAPLTADKKLC